MQDETTPPTEIPIDIEEAVAAVQEMEENLPPPDVLKVPAKTLPTHVDRAELFEFFMLAERGTRMAAEMEAMKLNYEKLAAVKAQVEAARDAKRAKIRAVYSLEDTDVVDEVTGAITRGLPGGTNIPTLQLVGK